MAFIDSAKRFQILQRDRFTCRYCGRRAPHVELEVDHVYPKVKGGTNDDNNLVAACVDCNRAKRDKIIELPGEWDSLDGKFFHTIGTFGVKQGVVVGFAYGHLVVRHFDWISGAGTWGSYIVSLEEVARDDWRFYTTDEEMREAYEYGGVAEAGKRAAEKV